MHGSGNKRSWTFSTRKFAVLSAVLVLGWISMATGAMAWTGQTLAYVTTSNNGLSVIDTGNNKVVDRIPCCGTAAVAPDGKHIYAFDNKSSDEVVNISVIAATTDKIVAQIPLKASSIGAQSISRSGAIAVSQDGKYVYAATGYCLWPPEFCVSPGSQKFEIWKINTFTQTAVPVWGSTGVVGRIAFAPDGTRVYATAGIDYLNPFLSVLVFNTEDGSGTEFDHIGFAPGLGIVISSDGRYAYIGTDDGVVVLDTTTNVVKTTIAVGSCAIAVAMTPDGKFVYVTNSCSNTISIISTASNQIVGTPIPVGQHPAAIAMTPDGKFAYVANQGSNTVSVINTATAPPSVTMTVAVGIRPNDVAIMAPPHSVPFSAFSTKLLVDLTHQQSHDLFLSEFTLGGRTAMESIR